MEAKTTCGELGYSGDSTLGSRWKSWSERFQLFIKANGLDPTTDAVLIKASFLLLMAQDAFEIFKAKRKADSSDTLKEVQKFIADHFVLKKSEYAEICAFRRAMRHEGELVSDYAMRLRILATHCKFGAALDKEIERRFVVGCEMDEVQRKCSRTDNLDLATVLDIVMGFERVNASVNGLHHSSQFEETRRSSINYTDSREAPKFLQKTNDIYSRQDQTFRGKDLNVQSNCSQAL